MRDEFGREIPGRGGHSTHPPSYPLEEPPPEHLYHHHPPGVLSYSHGYPPPSLSLMMNQPLSSSRYPTTIGSGSGGGGGEGGGGGRHHHNPPRYNGGIRGQNHPHQQHHANDHHAPTPTPTPLPSSSPQNPPRTNKKHPSLRYTSQPLLCEYKYHETPPKDETDATGTEEKEGTTVSDTEHQPAKTDTEKQQEYNQYRERYCVSYIHSFFNQHLDDPWFRYMYSPYHIYHSIQQPRYQTLYIQEEVKRLSRVLQHASSLLVVASDEGSNDIPSTTTAFHDYMDQHLRLWERTVTTTASDAAGGSYWETPHAHLLSIQSAASDGLHQNDDMENENNDRTSTTSKIISALHITDIPTHMSDAHILIAFRKIFESVLSPDQKDNATTDPTSTVADANATTAQTTTTASAPLPTLPQLQIWPSQQMILQKGNIYHYARDVVVTGTSEAMDMIFQYFAQLEKNATHHDRTDIPRKQHSTTNNHHHHNNTTTTTYRMEVECTDLYGRKPAELQQHLRKPDDPPIDETLRTHPVWVSRLSRHPDSKSSSSTSKCVTVRLSAALSSTERIEYDTYAAQQIATALDDIYEIPTGYRLRDLLEDASICHDQLWTYQASDQLDFVIAYLRRVHLFSYYNGCCFVNHSVCDVVTGKNAVSTIHVRMKNADTFLQDLTAPPNDPEAVTDHSATNVPKKDLLVQRLDDAIAKALHEYCGITEPGDTYNSNPPPMTIAAERQAQLVRDVTAIQETQDEVQQQWLSEYSGMVDPDGRARCSKFVNCGKLFKERSFLCKHLLKKHSEHLHAEQAKCHDAFMMKAWDAASERPVPDILVDCGKLFGTVACKVSGTIPTCIDPEPELWRQHEERRQRAEEMSARRAEMRNQQQQQPPLDHSHASQPPRPHVPKFVDVDDMKVEKVEISFDNIIVPDVATTLAVTNKKKKRKLL